MNEFYLSLGSNLGDREHNLSKAINFINYKIINKKSGVINLPNSIKISDNSYEFVGKIIKDALISLYELKNSKKCTILNLIKKEYMSKNHKEKILKLEKNIENLQINDILYLSNFYNCIK